MKKISLAVALGVLLAGGSALADDQKAQDLAQEAYVSAGRMVFHHCEGCHALDSAKNGFGPSLFGVVGRPSASVPRFDYSPALRKANLVWTEANLRRWISGNDKLVPGTRMRHVAITDPAEQDYLIAFLKTLK